MILVSPNESIYHIMYVWGLKHYDLRDIEAECAKVGKDIRRKDYDNYWNGWHRSSLYHGPGADNMFMLTREKPRITGASREYFDLGYNDYPEHPWDDGIPEVQERWVPCSAENKPLIPWSQGCMTIGDAVSMSRQVYLAENLKGTHTIVIDCDGNHGEELDLETMYFLNKWRSMTHCIVKPGYSGDVPESFHLTFSVDRIIPTMHFPYAHIDFVGNQKNSLRYWKNKQWNHVEPAPMTEAWWQEIQGYIKYRKEKADGEKSARLAQCRSGEEHADQG